MRWCTRPAGVSVSATTTDGYQMRNIDKFLQTSSSSQFTVSFESYACGKFKNSIVYISPTLIGVMILLGSQITDGMPVPGV